MNEEVFYLDESNYSYHEDISYRQQQQVEQQQQRDSISSAAAGEGGKVSKCVLPPEYEPNNYA